MNLRVLLLAAWMGAASLHARIGDSPEELQGRLQGSGLGRPLPGLKTMEDRERNQILRESPLHAVGNLLPESEEFKRHIFWKNASRSQSGREDGWRLHAHFLRGRSVAEAYRRVGAGLSDAEMRALLATFRGAQAWRRVDQRERGPSVLGYDFELGEPGAVTLRARRQGDVLLVFDKRLDDLLLERKAAADAEEKERRAAREQEQERSAPSSVEGF